MIEETMALLKSREWMTSSRSLESTRSQEAEGGCGVVGIASTVPLTGKHLLGPLVQMHNRGNGKGGGIAAVGLSAERMGVSEDA